MSKIEIIKKNIFLCSLEKNNVLEAFKEWRYDGVINDLGIRVKTCELCEQPELRYQFQITNVHSESELWVGSECIKKFNTISVTNKDGVNLSYDLAVKKIDKDRRKMIVDSKTKSMLNSLVQLSWKDEEFDIEDFIKYFKERGAFTPNQLSTVIWRLEKHQTDFEKGNFKCTIKRIREREQLLNMEDWKIKKIWECLSPSQKTLLRNKN